MPERLDVIYAPPLAERKPEAGEVVLDLESQIDFVMVSAQENVHARALPEIAEKLA
jgi:hypothetical protein